MTGKPSSPAPPTQTLRDGRFVVLAAIGEGSQGRTFDGFDRLEGRAVAIKRFDVRGARSWKDVDLAEREARVLQSLSHPKLPRYVDRFEEGGALYLVMEKIEGESLSALRARGATLSQDDVLRLLRDAGEVLDYLHGRAPPVIHRDLKPGNVIRRPDGSFAFVDFGAVRDKLRPEGGSTVVGTFGYMAPEQFQGRALPASDVYAMGATALSMLTGQQPEDLPHRGLAVDVRAALQSRGGRGSERLADILESMLEPDPDRRASRIAPLLEGSRRSRTPSPETDRARDRHGRHQGRSEVRDSVEEAMNRYAEQRARREARRRQRHEARQARRRDRIRGGFPFPLSLLLSLAFAVGIVAVTVTTQLVVPLLLTLLSVFVARSALRRASATVRETGRFALDNMERSRRWLEGDMPKAPESEGQGEGGRVRVDPQAPGPGVRVAGVEREKRDGDEEEEEEEEGGAGNRGRVGGKPAAPAPVGSRYTPATPMHATPEGFLFLPGTERITATAVVFDVRLPGDDPTTFVCKRLGSRAAAEPWVRARLAAEGKLLQQLGARGTPRFVAAGEDASGPWIVMARAEGEPLSRRIGVPVPPGWITRAARLAFGALGALHAASVIDADLNPDNILVTGDGRDATVLDFGLAVWPGAPPMPAGPFRGTPAYAAPEVARGESFDARADLFGLAATLLHVASGQSPRPQEHEAAVLLAAGEQDPEPWARRAADQLPAAVADALVRCCAFDAAARPASSAEVCALLGPL